MSTLSPERRRQFRVWGGLLLVIGLVMFLLNGVLMFASSPDPSGGFEAFRQESSMAGVRFVLLGFGGLICLAVGSVLLRLGFLKAAADVVSTETAGAVEHSSAAWGRGLAKGLHQSGFALGGAAQQVVKVKCRSCGYLESEDAKFCSQCAKPL